MTGTLLASGETAVDTIPAGIAALRRGEPVVVVPESGEHQLVIAAERVTATAMALLVRHSSGFVCVAVEGERLAALDIPLMPADDAGREAFAVSVDAVGGLTTGISAHERARTARALADPATRPEDLVRPGHVVPLRVHQDGVVGRPAAPEAATDLCRLAGLVPAAVFAAIPESASEPLPAALGDLPRIRVQDVVRHRERVESPVTPVGVTPLVTRHGLFAQHTYVDVRGSGEHLALVAGEVRGRHAVPVRVHAECLRGDVLGSVQCGCAGDLDAALEAVVGAGHGAVVYVRGAAACDERSRAADRPSVTGHRDRVAAHVLRDLGVRSAVLLTDDPEDAARLTTSGLPVVDCAPLTPDAPRDVRATVTA